MRETASPLTLGGGVFNAAFSQVTNTDPKYGTNGAAFAERFAASIADIATQNFFGDFVVASALHEDPRYFRKGEGHSLWSRTGYAISRALVIRQDSGGNTFNYDNVVGSALGSGFSNLYYPAASRGGKATLMHFAIDLAGNPNSSRKFTTQGAVRLMVWSPKAPVLSHARTNTSCHPKPIGRFTFMELPLFCWKAFIESM